MISSAFWRERRIFLTGHTGFKGAWLCLMLERLNARVTGYGLDPATDPSLYELADAGLALCDVRGDVADEAMLDGALRAADPDLVIHMATRPPRDGRPAQIDTRSLRESDRAVVAAVEAAPFVQTALIVAPEARKQPRRKARRVPDGARVLSVFCPDPIGGGDFAGAPAEGASAIHALDALFFLLQLAEKAGEGGRLASTWALADAADAADIGWSPLLSPQEARAWTREWQAAHGRGADMRAFTLEQVDRYLGQRVRLTSPFDETAAASLRAVA